MKKELEINYWLHIRKGRAKKVFEDYEGAIDEYNKAINIFPHISNTFFYRGNINFILKNYNFAIQDYSEAIKGNNLLLSKQIILEKRGISYLFLSKYENAIADFTQSLKIENKSILLLMRGYSYAKRYEYDLAIKDICKSINIDPDILNKNKKIQKDLPLLVQASIKINLLKYFNN